MEIRDVESFSHFDPGRETFIGNFASIALIWLNPIYYVQIKKNKLLYTLFWLFILFVERGTENIPWDKRILNEILMPQECQHHLFTHVQGDQLFMALYFSDILEKTIWTVYACTVAYSEQVTFYKVPEKQCSNRIVALGIRMKVVFESVIWNGCNNRIISLIEGLLYKIYYLDLIDL